MSALIIDDQVAERLRQIALQEHRPIDELIRAMLEVYTVAPQPSQWPLEMAKMAEADTEIEWNEYSPELSERSREILENEFGDYLLAGLTDHDNDSA